MRFCLTLQIYNDNQGLPLSILTENHPFCTIIIKKWIHKRTFPYLCIQISCNRDMSKQEPKRLPLSSLKEMIDADFKTQGVRPYLSPDFAIVYGSNTFQAMRNIFEISVPYRVDDFRFIAFQKGDVDITANLLKFHVTDNTVGFMGNGGIIQMDRISSDVSMSGIVVKEDFLRRAMGGRLPVTFNGRVHNFYLQVTAQECDIVVRMILTLRLLVEDPHYSREASASLIAAIVNYIAGLYERYGADVPATRSRQQDVFNRFIALVNEQCFHHHTLDYYADKMCITQRYLGTLVKQASGTTAKEWIDRALINEAKVALRHSDITVAQLADSLSFPNPAFFSKFFKRMTGMTPSQYKHQ